MGDFTTHLRNQLTAAIDHGRNKPAHEVAADVERVIVAHAGCATCRSEVDE